MYKATIFISLMTFQVLFRLFDSVIHQYNCHEDMPSFGEGGCDRLNALKGALFRLTLLTHSQTRVCGFSSPETLQTQVST